MEGDVTVGSAREWAIRPATVDDAETTAAFRRMMFESLGARDVTRLNAMEASSIHYFRETFASGEYHGWFAEAGTEVVGSVGVVVHRIPPSYRNPVGVVGYIMNLYVVPEWRRKGIARSLMQSVLDFLDARGVDAVSLHASEDGRQLYRALGFDDSSEMRRFKHPVTYRPRELDER